MAPTTNSPSQQAAQSDTRETVERPAAGTGLSIPSAAIEEVRREYAPNLSDAILDRYLKNNQEGAQDPKKNIGITHNVFEQTTQERVDPRRYPVMDRTLPSLRRNDFSNGLLEAEAMYDRAVQNTGVGTFADTMALWDAPLQPGGIHDRNYAAFQRLREEKTNPDGSARVGLRKDQVQKYAGMLPEEKDVEEIRQEEKRNSPKNREQVEKSLQKFRQEIENVPLSNGMKVSEASQKAQQINQEVEALMKELGAAGDSKSYNKERADKWREVLQKTEEARKLQELVDGRYQRAAGAIKQWLDKEDVHDRTSKNVADPAQAKLVRDQLGNFTDDGRKRLEEEVAFYQGKVQGVEKSLETGANSVPGRVRAGIEAEISQISSLLTQDAEKERQKKGNVGSLTEEEEKRLKEYRDEIQRLKGSIGKKQKK